MIVIAFVLSLLFSTTGYAEQKEDREVIKVGFFAFDGYHMMNEKGEYSGYGYDFLSLASRYIDVDYEYIGYENSWDDMLDMLADGQIDLVTSAQMTKERIEEFEFSEPIGTSSAMLTVKQDNKEIIAANYSTYNGIRIGMLEGNSRNEDLEEYANGHGFSYTPVYFELHTELEQALQSGQVDAILTSSLRQMENERVIDTFAASDFYVVVRHDDIELLEKINYAIEQLNATEGDWKSDLNNKYYDHLDEKNLKYTAEELELIQQYVRGEKTLVITGSMDRAPYTYVEDGELKGIIPDYFARLAEYAGIPYEILIPTSREEYEQWRFDGTVNGFMDARIDSRQWMEEHSCSYTVPYTEMHLAMVTRRDFNGDIKKLAVANAQGLFGIEDNLAKDAQRIIVDSRTEAMQAVLEGEADAAFVYLYTAQQFVNQDERGLLTYTMLDEPSYDYHIAFMANTSHELSGIFTKAIYAMPEGLFEEIASQYTSYKAEDVNVITWIKIYPISALMVCVVIFLLCLFAVLLFERQKAVKLEKKRSEEFQKLAEEAERANHAKSDFLANVSHDIRTPMNAIVGITNLMAQEKDLNEKMSDYIKKIHDASRHLMSLIDDVLDMSRIEASKTDLNVEIINLEDQIRQVEVIIRETANQRQQTFNVHLHHLEHKNVITDGARLRQILLNLLSNAVKYTQKGGTIDLELEEQSCDVDACGKFCFFVRDNGCGMTEDFLTHIFEPFVRSEASVTNKVQGTGLGMSITKRLVDLMDGDIRVESELGKGTHFEIVLTMQITSAKEIYEPSLGAKNILNGMRFLCAEDNELNAEILEATLKLYGASCTIYPDGLELVQAFEKIQQGDYDAILMDIQMPNMNGLEAAKTIRSGENSLGKIIPIIAMSANAFKEDIVRSKEYGMNAHLSKPIDMNQLEKTMQNVLNDSAK